MNSNFDDALLSFLKTAQELVDRGINDRKHPDLPRAILSHTAGKRYTKITIKDSQESVWAFIDNTNGDVLKPATFKVPAKHARGNIFDEHNGTKTLSAYGPAYLK